MPKESKNAAADSAQKKVLQFSKENTIQAVSDDILEQYSNSTEEFKMALQNVATPSANATQGGGAGKVDGCNYIPVGQAFGQQGRSGTDGLGQRHLCADVSTVDAESFGTDLYNGAITGNIAATMGTAGSSVSQTGPTVAIRMRSGCDGGGKGALISNNQSLTLGTSNDQTIITK